MTSSNFQPLLPKTKSDFSGGNAAGEWQVQTGVSLFNKIGASIDFAGDTPGSEINSIPSPWSRALQLLSAIRNPTYPNRNFLIAQYRGLLATLALAENLCLQVEASRLDLNDFENNSFARSLLRLKPLAQDCVFPVSADPWTQLFIFSLDNQVIGFTSPGTLVVPVSHIQKEFTNPFPWVKEGKFLDPVSYLTPMQKQILGGWLQRLKNQTLSTAPPAEYQQQLAGSISTVLSEFAEALVGSISVNPPRQASSRLPFQVDLSPALLRNLYPAGIEIQSSNVQVLPSEGLIPTNKLYLYDSVEMPAIFNRKPQEVNVVGPLSLANFSVQTGKLIESQSLFMQPADIFNDELFYTPVNGAFPGSWLGSKLPDQDYSILLPINSSLQEYFTSNDLHDRIELSGINTPTGPGIRVTITLKLSGFDRSVDYSCYRDYPLKPENEIRGSIPTLALWPFVSSEGGWKEYYLLSETTEGINLAFGIEQPTSDASIFDNAKDGSDSYQYWRCKHLPQMLVAVDMNKNELGIIPLIQPKTYQASVGIWTVGVDFGTSLTNVAVRKGSGKPESLLLRTHLQPISQVTDIQAVVLREFFVPLQLLPEGQNPPMSTVITTRGWQYELGQIPNLIGQARAYFPRQDQYELDKPYIHTNVKWEQTELQDSFLSQLLRLVAVQAASEGVKTINWRASYPTAFSRRARNQYIGTWRELITRLKSASGQDHLFDEVNGVETESVAFAQYCADIAEKTLVHTCCVDIGGGTSDISIWQKNELVHQVSIPFAGRDFFHRILNPSDKLSNLRFFGEIVGLPPKTAENLIQNLNGRSKNFDTGLDTYLREKSVDLLSKNYRAASSKVGNKQNIYFRNLMAFSIAGLYHYIGIVLSALEQEGKILRKDETTAMILGGNGARFLDWLNPNGAPLQMSESHILLEAILAKASHLRSNPFGTELSSRPKAEACQGLVVDSVGEKLKGMHNRRDDFPVSGSIINITGNSNAGIETLTFGLLSRIEIPNTWTSIVSVTIGDFSSIDQFIKNFNEVINDNSIEEFTVLQRTDGEQISRIELSLRSKLEQYVDQQCKKREGDYADFLPEPAFIITLKCLIRILAEEWAAS